MAKKIKWNNRALNTFHDVAVYLEEEYSTKTSEKFVQTVFAKVEVLQKYPTIGRKAPNRKTIRFVLVEKHYRLYYRVSGATLVICSLFDTRQHTRKDIYR